MTDHDDAIIRLHALRYTVAAIAAELGMLAWWVSVQLKRLRLWPHGHTAAVRKKAAAKKGET